MLAEAAAPFIVETLKPVLSVRTEIRMPPFVLDPALLPTVNKTMLFAVTELFVMSVKTDPLLICPVPTHMFDPVAVPNFPLMNNA